jgi:UDPglucose--hexose-1-phosphate uridylyltransferase
MGQVRVDPLTGLKTIIASGRAARHGDGGFPFAPHEPIDPGTDPFLEGREDQTPPELHAVRPTGTRPDTPGWTVRVVPNRYPALTTDSEPPARDANPDLFTALAAGGAHEVIVNAPQPVCSLAELDAAQVHTAVEVWRERLRAHAGAASRHLFVNEGRAAGASLPHTHAQLYALDFVPALLARERERFSAYSTRTMGSNLLADLVQEEVKRGERIVAIDEEAVALCPFASRAPFQVQLVPRRARARFEDDGPLASALLQDVLARLGRALGAQPALNMWVRTAPRGADHFCWRIDLLPRLTVLAGLEIGTAVNLNVMAPERAAAALREA